MHGRETMPIVWPSIIYPGMNRLLVPESHTLAEIVPHVHLQRRFRIPPSSEPYYYDSPKEWQSMEYGIAIGDKDLVEEGCEQLGKSTPAGPGNLAAVFKEAFVARAMKSSVSYDDVASIQTKLYDIINLVADMPEDDEAGRTRGLKASVILMALSPALPLPASRRERANPFSTSYNHTFYLMQKDGKIPIRTRYVQTFDQSEIAPKSVAGVSLGQLADLVLRNATPGTGQFYGDAAFKQLSTFERRRQALSLVSLLVVKHISRKPLDSTEQKVLRLCRTRFSQKIARLTGNDQEA